MKKILIGILVLFSFVPLSRAQTIAKAIYFELGGPGLASFNYDMRFSKSDKGLGARVGLGGFSIGSSNERGTAIFIPLALNYIISKDNRNYLELGAGITPVILKETNSDESESFKSSFGHVNIGYRLQPKNGGLLFRASITPVFGKNFLWPYYGGVSIGYKF